MKKGSIAIGIWKGRQQIESKALLDRFRNLTISWLRFGYKDEIFEGDHESEILIEASQNGYDYCLLIPYGNILVERWVPNTWGEDAFSVSLKSLKENNNFILAGTSTSPNCSVELINITTWKSAEQPILESLYMVTKSPGELAELPANFLNGWVNLHLPNFEKWSELKAFIINRNLEVPSSLKNKMPQGLNTFFNSLENQTKNSRKGVFLWNLESYDDIEQKPDLFVDRVSTLYAVAAGFKPNRILETHGFDTTTKVVYYDYSPNALKIRKTIVDQWDGVNFPAFARKIMHDFPHPDNFYQLWDDITPDTLNWKDMDAMWKNELEKWGGAENFQAHWLRYRSLAHEYVQCDLWSQQNRLLEQIGQSDSEVIWWSNAFLTIFGNWSYDIPNRREAFDQWMAALSHRNKDLIIYGSDHINTSVSGLKVSEYINLTHGHKSDELKPIRLAKVEIRM